LIKLACMLEPRDRQQQLLRLWLPDIQRSDEHTASAGDYDKALSELLDHGLVTTTEDETSLVIEPAIEQRVRHSLPAAEQARYTRTWAQLWLDRFQGDATTLAPQTVHSGIAASVYGRRTGEFDAAFELLAHHVLPIACRSGEATPVLIHMQHTAAESGERALIERCEKQSLWLANAHREEGKLDEALITFEYGIRFSNKHELGPVSRARWHVYRVEFLRRLGRNMEVLAALDEALELAQLAHEREDRSALREAALESAAGAAKGLHQWEQALSLNRRKLESMRERGADQAELARARIDDSGALIELGDFVAADELLRSCEQILHAEPLMRAYILSERGILASKRGEGESALRFKRESLQLYYQLSSWRAAAHGHEVYANELVRSTTQTDEGGAHYLAAAVMNRLSGDRAGATRICERLGSMSTIVSVPRNTEELVYLVERTPGIAFSRFLAQTGANVSALVAELLEYITQLSRTKSSR
jgi:tetratricopeptide (TPR) repeat protein